MKTCTTAVALGLAASLALNPFAMGQAQPPSVPTVDAPHGQPAGQAPQAADKPGDAMPGMMAGNMQADRTINSQLLAFSAKPEETHDACFALKAGCANMEEIEFGKAVAAKASDPKVKELANMMVKDHQMAMDKLKPVGEKLGVKYPSELPTMKQAELNSLKNMPVDKMEKAYLSMMKAAHLKVVNDLTDHLPMIKDADLKAWTSETLPKVRAHTADVLATASAKGLPIDLKFEGGHSSGGHGSMGH